MVNYNITKKKNNDHTSFTVDTKAETAQKTQENETISLENNYLVLHNNYILAYTPEGCILNNENPTEDDRNISAKEKAEDLKRNFYRDFLTKHYKNLVILTAAGTSLGNGGKTREGLWEDCSDEIKIIEKLIPEIKQRDFYRDKNIEMLLSYIINYEKINDLLKKDNNILRKNIEEKIAQSCKLSLSPRSVHKDFIYKITARKNNDPRIQLFTTNYDTLFEQASGETGFVIIDGFSFTEPRTFSGNWFDLDIVNRENTRLKQEESFISKVFHLYKLHGSLNWTKSNNMIIQKNDPSEPLIIYPADEKYENSFEQPYFEMMSRFQQALRKENTLLIVIGFSFQDKHIKNAMIEAVEQNRGFQLLILNYSPEKNGTNLEFLEQFFSDIDKFKVKRGVTIIFESFEEFVKNYPENGSYSIREEGEKD
ncbi:MAG: SIR2 family protein [Treponema sp.]|nr:SIR2 family protein [Treponema sp.]